GCSQLAVGLVYIALGIQRHNVGVDYHCHDLFSSLHKPEKQAMQFVFSGHVFGCRQLPLPYLPSTNTEKT
ncbi:hypothetical protein, partial [Thiolapillus sp.]